MGEARMSIDPMTTLVIPKPAYNILRRLTGESRPDIALSLALKDLIRLKIESARTTVQNLEQKYGMSFEDFNIQWQAEKISGKYTYEVEQDYLTWESALTDLNALDELSMWMT
jgi:hypothetical protein